MERVERGEARWEPCVENPIAAGFPAFGVALFHQKAIEEPRAGEGQVPRFVLTLRRPIRRCYPINTVGQPGGMIFPVGEGMGATQLVKATMSPTRAAGMLLISTVNDPKAIIPGPPGTHGATKHGIVWSVTRAAGKLPINTVGAPGEMITNGIGGCGTGVGTGAGG